ncbi:MAG: SLAC1 anion channel family protein [Actinomycetota bacterium]|nr:SLAC1 anion channel family protein [Actinomycetota bacterium]
MPTSRARLANFPISYFAIVMGLAGATIAWEKAHSVFDLSTIPSDILLALTAAVFVVLAGIYTLKGVRFGSAIVEELQSPVKLSFFPTISISLILLSIATMNQMVGLSKALWVIGTVAHLLLTLYVMQAWMHHPHFETQHLNPAWFIPVVGNILVPIAGITHGYSEISWFFFSVGLVFWGVLLVIVFNRMIFHAPIPARLFPTLFILIAPPAVGFIAYVRLTDGLDAFGRIMYYAALFLTLLLVSQIDRFTRLEFFLSWWAYSFPMAAITIATMVMFEQTGERFFETAAYVLLVMVTVLVVFLATRTTMAVLAKEICVEEG